MGLSLTLGSYLRSRDGVAAEEKGSLPEMPLLVCPEPF